MKAWQLQEVEARFNEVIEAALQDEPQLVARYGEPVVVIVSYGAFAALTQANTSLDDALANAPEELLIERERTPAPTILLE